MSNTTTISPEVQQWSKEMKAALKAQDQAKVIELWYGKDGGKYNREIGNWWKLVIVLDLHSLAK